MKILGIFILMVALDFVWARYTARVIAKRPSSAGAYASLIMLLNGGVTLLYVNEPMLLAAAAAGAFVGTFTAIKYSP